MPSQNRGDFIEGVATVSGAGILGIRTGTVLSVVHTGTGIYEVALEGAAPTECSIKIQPSDAPAFAQDVMLFTSVEWLSTSVILVRMYLVAESWE